MTNLLTLAHTLEHAADYARFCLAEQDAGREPRMAVLRERIEAVRVALGEGL